MKFLALDTNVLIYLCIDEVNSVTPIELEGMRRLLDSGDMKLILSTVVELEFQKRVREAFEHAKRNMRELKKGLKHMVIPSGSDDQCRKSAELKSELRRGMRQLYGIIKEFDFEEHLGPIEAILSHHNTIKLGFDNELLLKGYRRIIEKRAPSHKGDQLNDNIILETVIKYFTDHRITPGQDKAFFVSYDLDGFADKDKQSVHPDLSDELGHLSVKYSPFLAKILRDEFGLDEIQDEEIQEEQQRLDTFTVHVEQVELPVFPTTGIAPPVPGAVPPRFYPAGVTASTSGTSSTWRPPTFVCSCLDTLGENDTE